MYASKLSEKGQVTIPKAVREHLDAHPSDAVEFVLLDNGQVLLHVRNRKLSEIAGILSHYAANRETPVSVEDMNEVIRERRQKAGIAGLEAMEDPNNKV